MPVQKKEDDLCHNVQNNYVTGLNSSHYKLTKSVIGWYRDRIET